MIYKNIISFTILYFTDVFKLIFSPANDYFCTTKQKNVAYPTQPNPIRFSPYPLLFVKK